MRIRDDEIPVYLKGIEQLRREEIGFIRKGVTGLPYHTYQLVLSVSKFETQIKNGYYDFSDGILIKDTKILRDYKNLSVDLNSFLMYLSIKDVKKGGD